MQGDEGLNDLAADLHETVLEEPGTVDVLLGHYLGALVAMKLCESHSEPARLLVLEEPPGSRSTDFGEVAREALAGAFLARGSLEEAVQRGTTKEFNAGHGVHKDDFEGYVRLLAGWLGEPGA